MHICYICICRDFNFQEYSQSYIYLQVCRCMYVCTYSLLCVYKSREAGAFGNHACLIFDTPSFTMSFYRHIKVLQGCRMCWWTVCLDVHLGPSSAPLCSAAATCFYGALLPWYLFFNHSANIYLMGNCVLSYPSCWLEALPSHSHPVK